MEIVLLKTIKTLGKAGEVKKVKNGYANNFLLPYGWALPAKEGFIKEAGIRARKIIREMTLDNSMLEALVGEIDGRSFSISKKAGKEGKLFGSVKADDIVELITTKTGKTIDEKYVQLEEPIKKVGEYNIVIGSGDDLRATIKLTVEGEESEKAGKKVLKKTPMKKVATKAKKK